MNNNSVKNGNQRNSKGQFTKGNSGRPKGSKDKFTDLKQAFLDVFEKIEEESGKNDKVDSLFKWATKNNRNQGTFYQIISKMLPSNVNVAGSMNITYEISDKFMPKIGDEKK